MKDRTITDSWAGITRLTEDDGYLFYQNGLGFTEGIPRRAFTDAAWNEFKESVNKYREQGLACPAEDHAVSTRAMSNSLVVEFELEPSDLVAKSVFCHFRTNKAEGPWIAARLLFWLLVLVIALLLVLVSVDKEIYVVAGAVTICYLLLFCIDMIYMHWQSPASIEKRILKSLEDHPRYTKHCGRTTVAFSTSGITISKTDHTISDAWAAITKVVEQPMYLFFCNKFGGQLGIPRRLFTDTAWNELKQAVNQYRQQASAAQTETPASAT